MELKSNVLIFPGQGSQRIGMGKNLYDNFAVAKDVFEQVDDALEFNLSALMFDGDADELNKTSNAQPAIMAVSMAYFEVLKNTGLLNLDDVKFMAGHSLGEYSALCAAGVLSLDDTAKLLKARGGAMMQACIDNPGSMAAIIGLNYETVKEIADNNACYVGNSNSPAQIVLSGSAETVGKACEDAKAKGAKRAVMLPVSGAFHSPLMQSAADAMEPVLSLAKFAEPVVSVISNLTAKPYENASEIKSLLLKQITNTVKWQESVVYMAEHGSCKFIETGFGNVLSGLVKKILPEAEIAGAEDLLAPCSEAI